MAASKKSSGTPRYWLFKSEETCYSIDDLKRDKTTFWDGIRNYQARNMLRDEVQVGDGVLFYHSSSDPLAVVGSMTLVKPGYPDHTQFDPKADHYDAKADKSDPRWFMVDVKFVGKFPKPVTREDLKSNTTTA